MSILILGGDRINSIKELLYDLGVINIIHWTARNQKRGRKKDKPIPIGVNIVIMLTNFLNHNSMKHYRAEAKSKSIPIVYSTRSSKCLREEFIKVISELDEESEICKMCKHYLSCYEGNK
jgi:hypothetical protein